MTTKIRKAAVEDISSIRKLINDILITNHKKFISKSNNGITSKTSEFSHYITGHMADCDLMIYDKIIIGFTLYHNDHFDLMMDKNFLHKKDCGASLLQYAELKLFRQYSKIYLENFENDNGVKAFYLKHGWNEIKNCYDEEWGINKIIFSKFKTSPVSLILDSLDYSSFV